MSTVGIDPGLNGALACIADDGRLMHTADMPTVQVKRGRGFKTEVSPSLLAHLLAIQFSEPPLLAVLEDVNATPQMGTTSAFSFGRSKGVLEGALAMLAWPVEYVAPATWKKAMGLTKDKGACRAAALKAWPAQAGDFARVKDDGRAEAALLAEFGRRLLVERGLA